MGNGSDINFINFFTSALNNVSGANSVNNTPVDADIKVFNNNVTNPNNQPVFTDADLAEMWIEAGVDPTDAPVAAATTRTYAAIEGAGFDLAELDEIFADEPEVVAHTLAAFENGSATRISNGSQSYGSIIENIPEDAPVGFFDAFMYAINNKEV